MQTPRILARQSLRRAVLVMALLLGSSTTVVSMPTVSGSSLANDGAGSASAHTVTRFLPGDHAILLIESRDPANAGLRFVLAQDAEIGAPALNLNPETRVNLCLPCDILA